MHTDTIIRENPSVRVIRVLAKLNSENMENMKKKHLDMILEKVEGFRIPKPDKEQYATPATVASELLYFAFMRGDLNGTVYDLGCGSGIFAIGAKLLGAEKVIGFDDDRGVLEIARATQKNLALMSSSYAAGSKQSAGKRIQS